MAMRKLMTAIVMTVIVMREEDVQPGSIVSGLLGRCCHLTDVASNIKRKFSSLSNRSVVYWCLGVMLTLVRKVERNTSGCETSRSLWLNAET